MFTFLRNAVNHVFSKQASNRPAQRPARLPNTYLKILWFYYQLRLQGIDKADYSREELAVRLKLCPARLSTYLCDLEDWGLMDSDPHGSGLKKRWITFEGFSMLDSQAQHQTDTYTLYISSSDRTPSQILSQQQDPECAIAHSDPEPLGLESKLDRLMLSKNVPHSEVVQIKRALNRSRIGLARKIGIVCRVAAGAAQNRIRSYRDYFLACIKNEEKRLAQWVSHYTPDGLLEANLGY